MLLHGIGGSSESWERQLAALSENFRVMAWDMPGYGGSDDPPPGADVDVYVDILASWLGEADAAHAHILGQSVAAPVAARFCRRYPDRVRSFVFAHGLTGLAAMADDERAAARAARLEPFESLGPERFARERGPRILSPDAPPQAVERAVAIMARVRPGGYRAAVGMLAGADIFADLPHIAAPSLVLYGADDPVAPEKVCRRVAQALPASRFERLDGVGHYSMIEDPGAFNAVLGHFLTGLP